MIGSTISRYKVFAKLGEGGMGVVYKAQDTKLDRPVALKFLPAHLLGNEEVRKRFHREAKSAAALSHPNVCTVFEIDEADNQTFIAMELIEGESLDEKIARGPLPLDEALAIAQQIAEGLQAAHDRGVIHRDVKPENILVDPKGHVTIMDFGLAQLQQASRLTKADQTLGTTTYMSPEQAQGAEVDHRTDVWALGVVLYEMLVGERPFKGEYDSAILYSILNEQPEPITSLRTGVPMELEVAVNKALAKRPDERYQSLADFLIDLRAVSKTKASGSSRVMSVAMPPPAREEPARARTPWMMAAFALAAAFLGLAYVHLTQPEPPRPPLRRYTLVHPDPPPDSWVDAPRISPDGKHVAYSLRSPQGGDLWLWSLDQTVPRLIQEGGSNGFWSPDSKTLGFLAENEIRRTGIEDVRPTRVYGPVRGGISLAQWSPDGETIVFVGQQPLDILEVPASGGEPSLFLASDPLREALGMPVGSRVLPIAFAQRPGGEYVLFVHGRVGSVSSTGVVDLNSGTIHKLAEEGRARYSSGHYLYGEGYYASEIFAVPYSLETLSPVGAPFVAVEGGTGYSVSSEGSLVYIDRRIRPYPDQYSWRDRDGNRVGAPWGEAHSLTYAELSPDGENVAFVARDDEGVGDLWVESIARGVRTRLTSGADIERFPRWSPDGDYVAYSSGAGSGSEIVILRADGDGDPETVLSTPVGEGPSDWSPDGRRLLYYRFTDGKQSDLAYLERQDDGSWLPVDYLNGPSEERTGRFSPNGRYVAYETNESGTWEIHVRRFPEGDRKITVSNGRGMAPHWSADGKELFFVHLRTLMAAPVTWDGDDLTIGVPKPLFEHPQPLNRVLSANYDVSADGRFLVIDEGEGPPIKRPPPRLHVVLNWAEEFRDP